MRLLRGLAGALLWVLAAVLGLVGVIACVTVILLPLGIPLLMLTRRLFGVSMRLMMPRKLAHPVDELKKSSRGRAKRATSALDSGVGKLDKKGRKAAKKSSGKASEVLDSGKKAARRTRRRLG